jgi:hypothetical protein
MRNWVMLCCLLATPFMVLGQDDTDALPELPRSPRSEGFTNLRLGTLRQRHENEVVERERLRRYESRSPQFSVLATQGREQAERMQTELAAGWNELSRIMVPVTEHTQTSHDTVQVIFNNKMTDADDAPLAIVSQESGTTIIHLATTENEEAQAKALRAAAGYAALRSLQLQQHLPPWVVTGLAAFVANNPTDTPKNMEIELPRIAFATWQSEKAERGEPVTLQTLDPAAVQQVQYFLTSSQGAYAMQFLGTLKATANESLETYTEIGNNRPQLQTASLAIESQEQAAQLLESLVEHHAVAFEKWQANPHYDQPVLERLSTREDIAIAQQNMLSILSLLHSREMALRTRSVKVQEFRAGQAIAQKTTPLTRQISLEILFKEITDSPAARAITRANGELLLPHETEAIADFFGLPEGKYQLEWKDSDWLLSTRLNSQETLQAWLEPSKTQPLQPIAKYATLKR